MKKFSVLTKTYLIGTIVVGVYLLFWHLQGIHFETSRLIMLVGLCLAASLAQIIKVEGSTNRSHYAVTFVVYSFSLFQLGLPESLIVILVSNIAEGLWDRLPWFIAAFNAACYSIVLQVAALVSYAFNPTGNLQTWQSVVAVVFSMSAFLLLNHLMVGIIIWMARGENFSKSGMFDSLPLLIDLAMLVIGVTLNLVWKYNPYATLLFLIPLYLMYSTLRVPALERQTELDPKTRLFNHEYFMQQLESELTRADRYDRPLVVIMGDLDLLRVINNTYGHLAGDEVLKSVAKLMQDSVRDYDVVARFGGEEFVILMPETTPPVGYERAETIRKKIEEHAFVISTSVVPIHATISLGVVGRERAKQTKEELLHNADTAMYHSKLKGRNRTYVYNAGAYLDFIHKADESRLAAGGLGPAGEIIAAAGPRQQDGYIPAAVDAGGTTVEAGSNTVEAGGNTVEAGGNTVETGAHYAAAYATYQNNTVKKPGEGGVRVRAGKDCFGIGPTVQTARSAVWNRLFRVKQYILINFRSLFRRNPD